MKPSSQSCKTLGQEIFFQPIISTGDKELTVCEHPDPLGTWNIAIY